jgi:3-hydroxyacyl-CoA dehydrogenase
MAREIVILKRMALAEYRGRKNGRGFYDCSTDQPKPNNALVGGTS